MNELSDVAKDTAIELVRAHSGSPGEALAWHLQQTNDVATLIHGAALAAGLPLDHEIVRYAGGLMLPGNTFRRPKRPHCEACPLCGTDMQQMMLQGRPAWVHPAPDDFDEDRCMFVGVHLRTEQLPKWNMRAAPAKAQIAGPRGPCAVCSSLTPESYSKICGIAACPHK